LSFNEKMLERFPLGLAITHNNFPLATMESEIPVSGGDIYSMTTFVRRGAATAEPR
jgi:hypothetical protein